MKYRFDILNLDCAHCAEEVEEGLSKNSKLKNVIVNFNTSKLTFESDEEITLKEINELAKAIENSVEISETVRMVNEIATKEYHLLPLILGIVIGLVSIFIKLPLKINLILMIISYILLLYKHTQKAFKAIIKNKTINEDGLITISSIGAFLIGESFEGMMVVALYTIGKLLEEKAINKTRASVKSLLDIKQDFANRRDGENLETVDVNEIKQGDILVVKKGERVPVDGVIIKGVTELDTACLTGESEFVKVSTGKEVLSGSVNMGDVIEIKASEKFENSTVSRILTLIEEATDRKAETETMVSKISKIYTPTVLVLAVALTFLLPVFTDLKFVDALYRGLTFLVISCPCAIAISVPLSYFVGIGVSSKNNILIKGSDFLDNLMHVKKIIFDKTGTLTTGTFKVSKIEILDNKYTENEIIDIMTKGESLSQHPIAKSIMKLAEEEINNEEVINYKEIEGKGIAFELDNKQVKIGSVKLCEDCKVEAGVHLNIDGNHVASVTIDDGIKKHTKEAIEKLHKLGIKTYMFTGDKKSVANEIASRLGIDEVKSEMLPTDKFNEYEKLANEDERIAFVGDGINDAPVLKRAYVGISMGQIGSAAAIEASDVVIMTDDLIKIPEAIEISKATNRIIKQNLVVAISVKIIILLLSTFGLASMWMAVFADTGLTVLTIFNTLRIKKIENKKHEHKKNNHGDTCGCGHTHEKLHEHDCSF